MSVLRARIEKETGVLSPLLENHKHMGSNTGPEFLENYKATKPAFNSGPSLDRK